MWPVAIQRAVSGRRRLRACAGAPWNVRFGGHGRLGLWCNVTGVDRATASANRRKSARPLRRHVRPVLKHGPRSLTCERAIEMVESQTRNESEVSSDGTSGDPPSLVGGGAPAGHAIGWLAFMHC